MKENFNKTTTGKSIDMKGAPPGGFLLTSSLTELSQGMIEKSRRLKRLVKVLVFIALMSIILNLIWLNSLS